MEFKSQICTTREQSERLIAMGLKPETADMMWDAIKVIRGKPVKEVMWSLRPYYYPQKSSILRDDEEQVFIPAWSLNRLIEIMPSSIKVDDGAYLAMNNHSVTYLYYYEDYEEMNTYIEFNHGMNIYDDLINCIKWLIKENHFIKTYLVNNES